MTVRNFSINDVSAFETLHKENSDFPLPDISNKLYFSHKVVEVNGRVAAFGLLRLTSEAILIMDQSLPRLQRLKVILSIINAMIDELKAFDVDEVHTYVGDERTVHLLNRLGFVECQGKNLVLMI